MYCYPFLPPPFYKQMLAGRISLQNHLFMQFEEKRVDEIKSFDQVELVSVVHADPYPVIFLGHRYNIREPDWISADDDEFGDKDRSTLKILDSALKKLKKRPFHYYTEYKL